MSRDPDCIFCKIIQEELPATRIAEDERTLAFMDINPGSYGHALVIPKEHHVALHDMPVDLLGACMATAQAVAARAKDRLSADGVNLLNCAGAAAWQTVFHFHLHVIPRYAGQPEKDALTLPWTPAPGDPDRIAAAARALRA